MKKLLSLFICCLLSQFLLAQLIVPQKQNNYQYFLNQLSQLPENSFFFHKIQQFTFQENKKNLFNPLQNQQQSMPAAYAYKDLAFFCKIEVQLEKAAKLPIKFRLGSVDYVDYLEGKRDSY